MKKNIKRVGVQEGREVFVVTIRKNHAAEDYTEMVRLQESSFGKRRFKMIFQDFTENETEEFLKAIAIDNWFRNVFYRSDYRVNYSSIRTYEF